MPTAITRVLSKVNGAASGAASSSACSANCAACFTCRPQSASGLSFECVCLTATPLAAVGASGSRSEEHTSELQSLMRISYAVFCLKKKNIHKQISHHHL